MSEISRFAWWFLGLFLIIVSLAINWKKFFLFILVGVVFMVVGLVKHGGKIKEKKQKKFLKLKGERNKIINKLAYERNRKNHGN